VKDIKEFIHIKDPRWLYQYPIVSAHTHCDQLCLEAAAVAVCITASGDGLQSTVFAQNILQEHGVYIDGTEVVFQNADVHALFQKIGGIFADEGCFSGA